MKENKLLPKKTLDNLIDHANSVKNYEIRGYDFSTEEGVISYIYTELAKLASKDGRKDRFFSKKVLFGSAVIGKVTDMKNGRYCRPYAEFNMYEEGEFVGNQVDKFLDGIGYS